MIRLTLLLAILWFLYYAVKAYCNRPERCPKCKRAMVNADPFDPAFYWCENHRCEDGRENVAYFVENAFQDNAFQDNAFNQPYSPVDALKVVDFDRPGPVWEEAEPVPTCPFCGAEVVQTFCDGEYLCASRREDCQYGGGENADENRYNLNAV